MSEMVDEKKTEPPSPPAPAGPKAPVWPRIMRAWTGLVGLSWGATIAHAISQTGWLGAATIRVHRELFSAAALGVGAAAAAAIIVVLNRKLGKSFDWRKAGQGTWVRSVALVALGALAAFGCWAFYRAPLFSSTGSWWANTLWQTDFLGMSLALRPVLFPALGIFATVMFAVFQLLNREKWADFLIETEGELKKVSWPARKEYLGSAAVVVLVVAVISLFLFFVDHGMSRLFSHFKIGF